MRRYWPYLLRLLEGVEDSQDYVITFTLGDVKDWAGEPPQVMHLLTWKGNLAKVQ